ncbi:MAG: glycerophosphodiester phosphodiesterase family protein [Candidatus Promineifilaceae bacterium]
MLDLHRRKNGRPLLVGHRGAMAVAPENTMVSFEKGLAAGADILELDVQLTADNRVVVFHDTTLQGKTGAAGMIHDHTAEFLQTLDVGRHFDPAFSGLTMPLLEEVLVWAKGKISLMIELKHGPYFNPELDVLTVSLIQSHNMIDDVVVISPDQFALQRVKVLEPSITTSFTYGGRLLNPFAIIQGLDIDGFAPFTDYLTKEVIETIHEAGYFCSPGGFWWDYPTLIEWGVDTISSNDPASVVHFISP